MTEAAVGSCWNCGTQLKASEYGRMDVCRKCGRDTKTCLGCLHYDPGSYQQCRESQAERVLEKEKSNFCDYFKPNFLNGKNSMGNLDSKQKIYSAADALFKKK